ncbi:hypothetical protein Tco_0814943 [Tanacetum coccineum]
MTSNYSNCIKYKGVADKVTDKNYGVDDKVGEYDYEKEKLNERIGKLSVRVGIIQELSHRLRIVSQSTNQLLYFQTLLRRLLVTRLSPNGYCTLRSYNLLLWYSRRQHALPRSSEGAKYHGVTNAIVELYGFGI